MKTAWIIQDDALMAKAQETHAIWGGKMTHLVRLSEPANASYIGSARKDSVLVYGGNGRQCGLFLLDECFYADYPYCAKALYTPGLSLAECLQHLGYTLVDNSSPFAAISPRWQEIFAL